MREKGNELKRITPALQTRNLSFQQARRTLDGACKPFTDKGYEEAAERISRGSTIIHDGDFENAIFQLQNQLKALLSQSERERQLSDFVMNKSRKYFSKLLTIG